MMDPNVEQEAFKELLMKVRAAQVKEPPQDDEYLDPESLGAEEGGELPPEMTGAEGELPPEEGAEGLEGLEGLEEEEMAAGGAEQEPFDPAEMLEFFGKRAGSDRKPLKGLQVGMNEAPAAEGRKKKA
jgi:hypothetical protein